MTLRHRIAHWMGWNAGRVEVWTVRVGNVDRLRVGFRCECGKVSDEHWSYVQFFAAADNQDKGS